MGKRRQETNRRALDVLKEYFAERLWSSRTVGNGAFERMYISRSQRRSRSEDGQ